VPDHEKKQKAARPHEKKQKAARPDTNDSI
jgi:hypothetical protein